jgi:hypothetical protein
MRKLLHFDCPREVYQADACVVTCYDARFDAAIRKFLKRRGVALFDHLKIPGAAKALAAADGDAERDFVLRMVRISLALHHPPRAILIAHNDCGAYPGVPPDAIAADVVRAAKFLRLSEPSLPVECYFADFDGVYAVDGTA